MSKEEELDDDEDDEFDDDVLEDIAETLEDISETLEKMLSALTDEETGVSKIDEMRKILLRIEENTSRK